MKLHYYFLLLLLPFGAKAQCSVQVNDSLLSTYDYILNATNQTGTAPFTYVWTVVDGNGMPLPYTTNPTGDSITIAAQTLQNAYGCVIYQLCMNDNLGCSTCTADTNTVQVPFNCYSQFVSSNLGGNNIAVTLNSNIPSFLIAQQFLVWTDGNNQGQGMPYLGPNTVINYTVGPNTVGDKFFLCAMTTLVNGGCMHCDSIPFTTLALVPDLLPELSIYPNPATETLQVSGTTSDFQFTVLSLQGQVLLQGTATPQTPIRIAELPEGSYLLHVETQAGSELRHFTKQD